MKQKLCTFPEYPSVHSVSSEVDVAQSFTDSDYFGIFKLFFHSRCCALSIIVCLYAPISWGIALYVPDRLLFAASDYIFDILNFFYYFVVLRYWNRFSEKKISPLHFWLWRWGGCGGEENTGDIVTFSKFNQSLTDSLTRSLFWQEMKLYTK